MRTVTIDQMEYVINSCYQKFAFPLIRSYMTGEIISESFQLLHQSSADTDIFCKVRLRNSVSVSALQFTVYVSDIVRLGGKCKMYLLTEEMLYPLILYYMIHPIYQYIWVERKEYGSYDSMLMDSSVHTIQFIKEYYNPNIFECEILQILHTWLQTMTNRANEQSIRNFQNSLDKYILYMKTEYPEAYRTSKRYKAHTCQVTRNGFILLEDR